MHWIEMIVLMIILNYQNKNDSDYKDITKISLSVQDRNEIN